MKQAARAFYSAIPYYLPILAYMLAVVFFSYQEGQTTWAKLAAIVLLMSATMLIIVNRPSRLVQPTFVWLISWFCWVGLGCFFALDQSLAFKKIITVLQITLAGYAIYLIIACSNNARLFGHIVVIVALINAIYVYLYPAGLVGIDGRVAGTLGNANLFGVLLVTGIIYAMAYAPHSKILVKYCLYGAALVLFFEVLQTGSRKAMMGSVLLGGLVYLISNFYSGRNVLKAALFPLLFISFVLIAATSYILLSPHAHRLQELIVIYQTGDIEEGDQSVEGRVALAKTAMITTVRHPLFGVGLDNYQLVRNEATGVVVGTYAHNNYLELSATTGLIGLLLYAGIYLSIGRRLSYLRRNGFVGEDPAVFSACVGVLLLFLLFDFAMVSYAEKLTWFILGGVIAQAFTFGKLAVQEK